jgi:hypothetical protein
MSATVEQQSLMSNLPFLRLGDHLGFLLTLGSAWLTDLPGVPPWLDASPFQDAGMADDSRVRVG